MKRAINIINFYMSNIGFRWIFCLVLASAMLSRLFYFNRLFLFAEETFTLLFVMVLWLAFHTGILLKRQFGNSRASLLPGYRKAHAGMFILVYGACIGLGILWQNGLALCPPWISQFSMGGVWGMSLLISLLLIVLGYLSMGRAILYGYCILLVLSVYSMQIVDLFETSHMIIYLPLALWISGLIGFVARLFFLKEESLEYGHLLTWPPKNFGKFAQYKALGIFKKFQKERLVCEKYKGRRGMLAHLAHWNSVDGNEPGLVGAMLWIVVTFYVLIFLKVDWAVQWIESVSQLFLMYVITPLVMVAVFYYKRLAFWGYDIIRPVGRGQYFKDQGVVVFSHLFLYWMFTVLALAVMPNMIFSIGPVLSLNFFGFLFLSGAFVFLSMSVLSVLSAIDSVPRIIINGGLLLCLAMIFLDIIPGLTLIGYIVCIWVCLASGLIFVKHGYHAWCDKEYV